MKQEKPIITLEIDRDALRPYIGKTFFLMGFPTFGIAWLLWFLVGSWWAREYARTFQAELTTHVIKIKSGVYFRSIKSIPLDRITDVVQMQGPVERSFRIFRILIQTASSGATHSAEGVIPAVRDPEKYREAILAARNQYLEDVARPGPI